MLTLIFALTSWTALCRLGWVLARDLRDQLNQRTLDAQDSFTPSMARWGYVGEKRGQR